MKIKVWAFNLLIFLSALFNAAMLNAEASNIGKKLPLKVYLKGLAGGELVKSDLQNKTLLIQFWASWCQSCSKTMIELDSIIKDYSHIKFFTVSVDEDMASAIEYFAVKPAKVKALRKKAYLDNDTVFAEKLKIGVLPTYIVVDRRGVIKYSHSGFPNAAEISKLKQMLSKES